MLPSYRRDVANTIAKRISEPKGLMQIIVGPRQTGKTTAVRQAMAGASMPSHYAQAVQGSANSEDWLRREWQEARFLATDGRALLIIDEVQLISQWSSIVKGLWDEDIRTGIDLTVVLTGSSSLLLQRGMREGLTGRFELIHCPQWYYHECAEAFGYSIDDYLYFGGYPGAARFKDDRDRWLEYVQDSIIAPSVFKDVISLDRITKPALMEALFTLGSAYSGQEISYRKIMGQLDDAGNATTIAHYLSLLSDAGLLTGLQKYSEKLLKTRASSPRLITHDTSLMVASYGRNREQLLTDPDLRGHLVESAIGAYLLKREREEHFDVFWWREGDQAVDFVIQDGLARTAIEVKSGRIKRVGGFDAFTSKYPKTHCIVVGSAEAPVEDFLAGDIPLFV